MIKLFKKGMICYRCGNDRKNKESYCNTGYASYDRHIWNNKPLKVNYQL